MAGDIITNIIKNSCCVLFEIKISPSGTITTFLLLQLNMCCVGQLFLQTFIQYTSSVLLNCGPFKRHFWCLFRVKFVM